MLRGWKTGSSALTLVTLSEGEASNWLSIGYLKRQVLILVWGEREVKMEEWKSMNE